MTSYSCGRYVHYVEEGSYDRSQFREDIAGLRLHLEEKRMEEFELRIWLREEEVIENRVHESVLEVTFEM